MKRHFQIFVLQLHLDLPYLLHFNLSSDEINYLATPFVGRVTTERGAEGGTDNDLGLQTKIIIGYSVGEMKGTCQA